MSYKLELETRLEERIKGLRATHFYPDALLMEEALREIQRLRPHVRYEHRDMDLIGE